MIENTPRCRSCGYQLKSEEGCTFCLDVKKMLVWPVVTEEDSDLSAQQTINTALRTLKRRLRRLERELTREGQDYQTSLTKELVQLSRALKELAGEQRKLEDREEQRYAALGIEGRIQLFIEEFFLKLPSDYQIKMLTDMRTFYQKQNTSLLEESNE